MSKKVFVLGGTGFLGYYTTEELLKKGYEVATISLPPMPAEDLFSSDVSVTLGNINDMTDEAILAMLEGCVGFIYAAGADERVVPKKPASKFFYEANVLPTQRLAYLAKEAGVKDFVVFGSYFAEFAERLPESNLTLEAYPMMRLLQEQVAFAEGDGSMTVTSLRLPYIFGTMPGREPLWKMFTEQIKGQDVFPALKGGTAMVTVEQVAEAAVGAMENGTHRSTYAIGDTNMKYQEFYQMMVDALGQDTAVPVVSYNDVKAIYEGIDAEAAKAGLEHGIHSTKSAMMQEYDLYLDPNDTFPTLNVKHYDVVASIKETLAKCVDPS
ncbi:epimerase [Enterococcus ureilyticus]|uniref:Epimerase n=2 Tax=Enterococcus TaxID=1350 RepID=A0A1E5HDL7_9ENTE|nr:MULTISPECIES: NAD-dependent epimerase/dehydratase family protein [Enterococcus]ALS37566.1 epimerase [Enterococcus rotai]MBM7689933.1 nucleoside-diphosphate-sugar epimerase [Enterococcus ureilyticus]OEG23032.1 epimerase [Enterococcus ureilyticus]